VDENYRSGHLQSQLSSPKYAFEACLMDSRPRIKLHYNLLTNNVCRSLMPEGVLKASQIFRRDRVYKIDLTIKNTGDVTGAKSITTDCSVSPGLIFLQ
jgi:hypothetical protein